MLCFCLITQGYIQQESRRKKILGWAVLPHPSYSLDLALSCFNLFSSLQNALNNKKSSQEDQMKTFVENFLSLKPTESYLRGINKPPNKQQEVIENNNKYHID